MSTINPHKKTGHSQQSIGSKLKSTSGPEGQGKAKEISGAKDSFRQGDANPSSNLLEMKSVPTWKNGAVPASPEQRAEFSKQIPDWETVKIDGTDGLRREYPMEKYSQGVSFTENMMELAKTERHHPKISLEWGKVTVEYHTHDVGGLHKNDFIGAAKADQFLLAEANQAPAKKAKSQTTVQDTEAKPGLLGMKSVPTWKKGAAAATPEQKAEFSKQIPEWETVKIDGTDALRREYPMEKYSQGVKFTKQMMELAKTERHHPKISLEWGKVTVEYHTHDVGGLHMNDFIGAAKADQFLVAGE